MRSGTAIVESHFVADQDWRIDFEAALGSQVQFLAQEEEEPGEEAVQNHLLREYLIDLTEACADELYRIYPKLQDCLEVHVYVLAHIVKISVDTPLPDEQLYINLAEEPNLEAEEPAPEAGEPNLEIEDLEALETMDGALPELDLSIGLVIGAVSCPGCDDGRNSYKPGRMRNKICRAC